jgi:hypothetical protein
MRHSPARLAAFVIRCYPRRWRERYADEVLALVEDVGIGWFGVLDLARGALRERAIELDVQMFAWCRPSEALINRRIIGRFLIFAGLALVVPVVVVGAARLLGMANVTVAGGVVTTFSWLRLLAYLRVFVCGAAGLLRVLREIGAGRQPRGFSASAWTSVSSNEVVAWSAILLAHLTVQVVQDPQGMTWRHLYFASVPFFLVWPMWHRGFQVDSNELGKITLERRRREVSAIGLGLDEPKADFRGRRG